MCHFPETLPWHSFDEDAVTQLCLPKGLLFQKHNSKPKFHPFVITREDGSRVYGATLTFYELIEDDSICNAMQSLQTMYDAETSHTNLSANLSHLSASSLRNRSLSTSTQSHTQNDQISHLARQITYLSQNDSPIVDSGLGKRELNHTPVSVKTNGGRVDPLMRKEDLLNNENVNLFNVESIDLLSSSQIVINDSNNKSSSQMNLSASDESSARKYPNRTITIKNIMAMKQQSQQQQSPFASPTKTMHYNILKDRLYASKCICLLSQHPFNRSFSKILHTLYDMVEQTDLLGISLESHLYNILFEIPMPPAGKLMQFQIGCKRSLAFMPDFLGGNDLPLLDYDLCEFFRLLGVSNVINLFVTAMLEHQILLYSKDYYLLMLVAESLTSLFFPFTWLKPYVPIVPASILHFIEAPVPYIMGFHHRDIDKEFFKQGQRCFVDIDSGTVTCPEGVPDFPEKNRFIKEINEIVVYFTDKRNKLKKQSSTDQIGPTVRKSRRSSDLSNRDSIDSGGDLIGKNDENGARNDDDVLQNSQAFARIAELARRTGALNTNDDYVIDTATGRVRTVKRESGDETVSLHSSSGISSVSTGSSTHRNVNGGVDETKSATYDEHDLVSVQFTRCIRELFLQKFVQMFASYEKFVIVPNLAKDKVDSWWNERDYAGNFDSKMFLIEQPSHRLQFLTHFIATQMFVSFIDLKIISVLSKKDDPNVKIFDDRIRRFKASCDNAGGMNYDVIKVDSSKTSIDIKELGRLSLRIDFSIKKF